MSIRKSSTGAKHPVCVIDHASNAAAIVQNVYQTIVSFTNVTVKGLVFYQGNDESAQKGITVRVTFDSSTPITASVAANHGTAYTLLVYPYGSSLSTTWSMLGLNNIKARSVTVEMEVTDAPGTNQFVDVYYIVEEN